MNPREFADYLGQMMGAEGRTELNFMVSRGVVLRRYIRTLTTDHAIPLTIEGSYGTELLYTPLLDLFGARSQNGIRFTTPPRPQRIPEVPENLSWVNDLYENIITYKLSHSPGLNNTQHVNSEGIAYTFPEFSFVYLKNQLALQLARVDNENIDYLNLMDTAASTAVICAARIIVPYGDLVLLEETISEIYRETKNVMILEEVYAQNIIFNLNKFTLLRRATVMSFRAAGGLVFNQPYWSEHFHFCYLINNRFQPTYEEFLEVATTATSGNLEPGANLFLTLI